MANAHAKPREYETIFILKPSIDADEADRVAGRVTDVVTKLNGKLTKVDNWGKRKLAYPIARATRGVFVFVKYVGFGEVVAEVERNLRLIDTVIRFQTIKVADDVDVAALAIDPEEVKFRRLEETVDEAEPTLEQKLGMVEAPRHERTPDAEDELFDEGLPPDEVPADDDDAGGRA